jgi:threonine-phosphate decarboxylase
VLDLLRGTDPAMVAAYPDAQAADLRQRLCLRHGAAPKNLVLGSGGAALLFLALRALAPRRVLVPQPCFREQPRAVAACGAELEPVAMAAMRLDLTRLAPGRCDAVLLTNPHNPTGQCLPRSELMAWLQRHPEPALVLDEAFMDYAEGESLLPAVLARPRTVVLRSLTKFYAMPALRVGYALADPHTARRMAALQEGWPVGELALRAALAAVADDAYAQRSLAAFHADAPAFRSGLEALGLRPLPSRGPFCLVPLPGSGTQLALALRPQGILVRTCAEWPALGDRYVRLALRRRQDWPALFRGLERWLASLDRSSLEDLP